MKKLSYQRYMLMMLLVLIVIGVLQFFELPKVLDYILLALAVVLGGAGLHKKLSKR